MKKKEEVQRLESLIKEDNVEELSNILNLNENLRTDFNNFLSYYDLHGSSILYPLLLLSVELNAQKVVEYLLSQDFVDKSVCNEEGENIYHVVCGIRGAEELFSIIERKVPHNLILNNSHYGKNYKVNAFHIACERNNVFIVKRVYEILESFQVDLTQIKNKATQFAYLNDDIEAIKYILSIDGIQLNDEVLFDALEYTQIDNVVYLLNVYLWRSIPSHLHNQFHIFHFSNHHPSNMNNNNIDGNDSNNNDYEYYLKVVEDNFNKLMNIKLNGNRIWHVVSNNRKLDVVKLIYSLKGVQPDLLNDDGFNGFLIACDYNSNIKVIKYLHKLFPSFIHSQLNRYGRGQNAAYLLVERNCCMKKSDKLKTLHYLYLNGIDIHQLFKLDEDIDEYLKVILQDFDYLQNVHDNEAYRKPSFWKQFHNNNGDEQSKRINVWKNRFEEHVLRHLSKTIQEHMLENFSDDDSI